MTFFQIGCIGLIKAIDNFDTTLQVKVFYLCSSYDRREIRRYLRDNNSIRVSRSLRDIAYKTIYTKGKLYAAASQRAYHRGDR